MDKIVLTRNESINWFCIVHADGSHTQLEGCPGSMKASEVARRVAGRNPGVQIGFLSEMFGPFCVATYGEVLWLKEGYPNC